MKISPEPILFIDDSARSCEYYLEYLRQKYPNTTYRSTPSEALLHLVTNVKSESEPKCIIIDIMMHCNIPGIHPKDYDHGAKAGYWLLKEIRSGYPKYKPLFVLLSNLPPNKMKVDYIDIFGQDTNISTILLCKDDCSAKHFPDWLEQKYEIHCHQAVKQLDAPEF